MAFARHQLLLVATSEMQHLRWANELLWRLHDAHLVEGDYQPVFTLATELPAPNNTTRKPALRRLELEVIVYYIFIEHPSTSVAGQYARVIATLRDKLYPPDMLDLALRIANEGAEHERSFMDMKRVFSDYGSAVYLRNMTNAPIDNADVERVRQVLEHIVANLSTAYDRHGDFASVGREIVVARAAMVELLDIGETMATQRGLGIPFFDVWPVSLPR